MKLKKSSKSERLIYIVIFLWVVFGICGMIKETNLSQLAGYYASLTLFVGTYMWGEYKRTSTSTSFVKKGPSSSREIVIYITVFLWTILGLFGIFQKENMNNLTVYFSALSPFVSSYIIYKTSKGADLPLFNGETQKIVDKATENADYKDNVKTTEEPKEEPIDPHHHRKENKQINNLLISKNVENIENI